MDFVLPSGARVAAPVVVRVAGLPVAALDRMRCEKSFARLCAVAEEHRLLAAEGSALSAELYPVIGAAAGGAERAALVGLRRAVFGVRMPADREWNAQVAAGLPADLADRMASWVSRLTGYARMSSGLEGALTAEIETTRGALRDAAGHWSFQRALSHASPSLSGETAKWLADPSRHLRRQSQVRLAKYVARAAAKTSPYSTFTISGTGIWTGDGPGVRFDESACVRSVPEVTPFLSSGLVTSLSNDARLAPKLPIRLNPSAIVHKRTVRFLGHPPAEAIVSVPATPAVLECLRILQGQACCTTDELRDLLAGGEGQDGVQVEGFIAYLIGIGLLQRRLPVADLTGDPLGEVASWLGANAGEGFAGTVRLVNRARSLLRDPASVADVTAHLARHRLLSSTLAELAGEAGLDFPAGREIGFLRDNAVFTGTPAYLSLPRWRPALEDLDVVRKVLAALDPGLPIRLGLAAYCAGRFGSGARVPLLILHEAIAGELASGEGKSGRGLREIAHLLRVTRIARDDLPGDGQVPRLSELRGIRQELRAAIESSEIVHGAVRVRPSALAGLSASWPGWVTAPPSVACYVQAADDGETLQLVLNTVHVGFGRGRSRALHLIRQADTAVPLDPSWEITPPAVAGAPALAELCGVFDFSLNVRVPSVPYEIDYPFTESSRPAGQRIPLRDLEVVHDPGLDQVHLAARGVSSPVIAQHLGMMSDLLLPPAARLIARAFGSSYFATGIMPLLTPPGEARLPDMVLGAPRIEIGRVVLRRARWVAPANQIPVRGKGESDSAYLVRMVTWLRANEIPTRCFVRMLSGGMLSADGAASGKLFDKSRKPVFVDFANWYLASSFERMLSGTSLAIFEEALPALEDAAGPDGAGARVMEFIVEISGPEARR